jgi:hypothetical protein
MPSWNPNVKGQVPPLVAEAVRRLGQRVGELEEALAEVKKTQAQVPVPPSLALIKAGLQVGGPAALDVTQLLGRLAQTQLAYVPLVAALPPASDPQSQDGSLVYFGGALYRYNQPTTAWVVI